MNIEKVKIKQREVYRGRIPSGSKTSSVMNFTVPMTPEWSYETDDDVLSVLLSWSPGIKDAIEAEKQGLA